MPRMAVHILCVTLAAVSGCSTRLVSQPVEIEPIPWESVLDEASLREVRETEAVMAKLRPPMNVSYGKMRLFDVLRDIETVSGVPIDVNWAALEAVGIERDTSITLKLKGVAASTVIEFVLNEAGSISELEPIGFACRDGRVYASTHRELNRKAYVRTYQLHPAVILGDRRPSRWADDKSKENARVDIGNDYKLKYEALVGQLVTLVMPPIGGGEDWGAYSGSIGSIQRVGDTLVIEATPDQHEHTARIIRRWHESIAYKYDSELRYEAAMPDVRDAFEAYRQGDALTAQRLIRRASRTDPQNPYAAAMSLVLTEASARQRGDRAFRVADADLPTLWPDLNPTNRVQKLNEVVTIGAKARTLAELIAELQSASSCNFHVDWASLEAVGIERDTPCLDRPMTAPLRVAVERVLSIAGSISELEPIGYRYEGDVVYIDTERDLLKRQRFERAYYIGRMLHWSLPRQAVFGQSQGQLVFDDYPGLDTLRHGSHPDAETEAELIEQLKSNVRDTIGDLEHWGQYGGDVATLRESMGTFWLHAPLDTHRKTITFLTRLYHQQIRDIAAALRHDLVIELLRKAERRRRAGDTRESWRLTQRALAIDPSHPMAAAMHGLLKDTAGR